MNLHSLVMILAKSFSVQIWKICLVALLEMTKGVLIRGQRFFGPKFAYAIVRIYSLIIYIDFVKYIVVGDTKASLLRCFLFFQAELRRRNHYWTIHEIPNV